jgi:hypothetical protein
LFDLVSHCSKFCEQVLGSSWSTHHEHQGGQGGLLPANQASLCRMEGKKFLTKQSEFSVKKCDFYLLAVRVVSCQIFFVFFSKY